MNRFIAILFLINFSFLLKSQDVIYTPVFIDQCTDSLAEFQYWWISDSDSTYNIDSFPSSIYLPKLGKYFISLEIGEEPQIINIETFGERVDSFYTKRVEIATYVSNPPFSEFFDCDILANGKITDYYYNGKIRLTGTFKDGQPIDTLKRFFRSGILKELYIPERRKRRQISYYSNGIIQEDFNFAKRYCKDYYETGEIKELSTWNRTHKHSERTAYFRNGQISLEENKKSQITYYPNGIIKNQSTRKEVFVFERIFTKYGTPWFEYQSYLYDSLGNKVAFYQFGGNGFKYGDYFPKDISEIKTYQFEKLIIYDKGKEVHNFDFYKIDNEDEEYRARRLLINLFKDLTKE